MSGTAGLFPETVHTTAGDLSAGTFPYWAPVTVAATRAMISYRFNPIEHERRMASGLGAVTSPELLRLLISLPVGERVRARAVPKPDRRRLLRAGVVAQDGVELVRLAVPPVELGIALVAARSWRQGLEMAGRFAPFCVRAMVLARSPAQLDDVRIEADFYGIGVIVDDGDGVSVLVPPARFVRERSTVGGWLFLEQLYGTVRRSEER